MPDTDFSALKETFNILSVQISGAANKIMERELERFVEQTVGRARQALEAKGRVATGELWDSIKFKIHRVGDTRKERGIRAELSMNAKSPANKYEKRHFYGGTIDQGFARKIGGVQQGDILDWMKAKGITNDGRSKRVKTDKDLARLIAYNINREGKFSSMVENGDRFLQNAIESKGKARRVNLKALRKRLTKKINAAAGEILLKINRR